MFDLEKAIQEWLNQFKKHRAFDDGELREMDLHIRDHIDDLLAEGLSPEAAFKQAKDEFGEIKPLAIEEFSNHKRSTTILSLLKTSMYKNYIKTSVRRLLKHPLSTVINLLGLAIAIGVCVLVYSFGYWVDHVDQHHENKDNVFLTTAFINRNGETQQWGLSPRPLGEMLAQDFPQLRNVCRIQERNVVIKKEDLVFHEHLSFVDPSYLEVFTFPLKYGDKSLLNDPGNIILSRDMALKYFGNENPIGTDVLVIFDNGVKKSFTVAAVAEKFPEAIAIKFDFLVHYDNIETALDSYNAEDWSQSVKATLVSVDNLKTIEIVAESMDKYKDLQNRAMEDWQIESFRFEPLSTLYQNSSSINKTISSRYYDTNKMSHTILSILAVFMLALAAVNYINIAIAAAAKRLKEMALRKTIGASRSMIVSQHLAENLVTTGLSLLLGIVFGKFILVPWFESQNGYNSGFHFLDINLWFYLVGVMLFTALISGLYPALYIARFQAVNIFKGKVKFGRGSFITKVFLGFQLVLASILIVCAIMFTQNNSYLQNRSWGYEPDKILYARVDNYSMFERLKDKISQYANLKEITAGSDHIGIHYSTKVMHQQEKQYEMNVMAVKPNYLSTVGLEVIAGRDFIANSKADKNSLVVNQKFLEQMALTEALGQEYVMDSVNYTITGIVKDFHFHSFLSDIEPLVFIVGEEQDFRNIAFSVTKGTEMESYELLKNSWAELFPEIPFRGGLQSDVWGSYFSEISWHGQFWRIIAYLTIFMAALGLFGMISLNLSGRVREFSIKKILGANIQHIGITITGDYLWLFLIAIGISSPLSYYLVDFFFDLVYPYHISSNIMSLIISAFILVAVLWVVIAILLTQVHQRNPIHGLKEE